ncbi:MAG: DUF4388 domain-containing protein [Nitrospinota bacterium]
MALAGSLKDFNITNILPIIKAENQTGVLEVKNKGEEIKITFLEGQIVYGETTAAKDSRRLRNTLVFNRMMTRDAWKQLQLQHTDELESIWQVLPQMVPPETASNLLRRQILDATFALMRFTKGEYNFVSAKKVEYPEQLIQPMDVDFLLMEGARVSDEWAMMEKRLPSLNAVMRKAITVEQSADESQRVSEDEEVADYAETLEFELIKERGIEIDDNEKKALSIVGKYKSVTDLLDGADLSYLDAGNAVVSLIKKKILIPMTHKQIADMMRPQKVKKGAALGYLIVLLTLSLFSAGVYYRCVTLPDRLESLKSSVAGVFEKNTQSDLQSIRYSIQLFYVQNGRLPKNIDGLKRSRLADDRQFMDRWGRPIKYEKKKNSFRLYSTGPNEFIKEDDISLIP